MAKDIPIEQLRGRTLGRILIKMGVLTRDKVEQCVAVQKKKGGGVQLGQVMLELAMIDQKQLNRALAAQRGMEFIEMGGMDVDKSVIEMIPAQMANAYRVIPLEYSKSDNSMIVAIDSPDNFKATDDLSTLMGYKVKAKVAAPNDLEEMLKKYYSKEDESINDLISQLEGDDFLGEFDGRDKSIDLDELKELAESNPVKKLLNLVLLQAIKDKASDIHFEPFEDEYKMRYRIDGVLYEMIPPPKHIAIAISSRIKVMANLDIAERRLPQDGRIPLTVQGHQVDLRVAILPTMFGESVVLRILDRSQLDLKLENLGLSPQDMETIRILVQKPNGILIVTGPTGCGKTTTLYSALKELNTIDAKLITTEDPVEYDIDGIIQVQMKPEIGLTFASCLRSILRQDPDVIMVGEIRDLETAQISAQASLTGHLVFTTLHTNDAPSAIARLIDLGLEPFLITATLEGVIAQRLVRKICTNCKEAYEPTEEQLLELDLTPDMVKGKKFYYGRGCDQCNNTGYKGRMGLYEIMIFDDNMRELVMNNASTNVLRNAAKKMGMVTLREKGLKAIFDGITTIEEVVKETVMEEQ
jgi:type IV pilus assembly protein PilB